jgi:hypothetical protein
VVSGFLDNTDGLLLVVRANGAAGSSIVENLSKFWVWDRTTFKRITHQKMVLVFVILVTVSTKCDVQPPLQCTKKNLTAIFPVRI